MLSPFLVSHSPPQCFYEGVPPPTHSCQPTLAFTYTGYPAFTRPRASPPIDVWQSYLLYMRLEPWVAPCALFGWFFSPWELWRVWLIDIVVFPMELQTPSAPSVLWLSVSIHLCICQALPEPLRRQLYQAPLSKHFLASTIVSEFVDCIWDESSGGKASGWVFLHFLLCSLFP